MQPGRRAEDSENSIGTDGAHRSTIEALASRINVELITTTLDVPAALVPNRPAFRGPTQTFQTFTFIDVDIPPLESTTQTPENHHRSKSGHPNKMSPALRAPCTSPRLTASLGDRLQIATGGCLDFFAFCRSIASPGGRRSRFCRTMANRRAAPGDSSFSR